MRLLLLVEGQSDIQALPKLARSISPRLTVDSKLVEQGHVGRVKTVASHIGYYCNKHPDTTRVIICQDSENSLIADTKAMLEPVARQLSVDLHPVTVSFSVVDTALEGWLTCDRAAVAKFLGLSISQVGRKDREVLKAPAKALSDLFKLADRPFIKTKALPELAAQVDVDRIAAVSPTFRDFRTLISTNPSRRARQARGPA